MLGKKVYIKTYGCQMNVHETEKMYAQFLAEGCEVADDMKSADILVFNTCCIREGAETRVLGNLGYAKKLKENKRDMIICVCGCMTQQEKMSEYLHKRCPFINTITGTFSLNNIVKLVKNATSGFVADTEENLIVPEGVNAAHRFGSVNNFVNITYGCNNFCTYCIVPYVKGRERSRRLIDIKKEVLELVSNGAKEITLLGQNVNSFKDESGNDFYALLNELAAIDGDFWVKFMTSHPKDLSKEVIKLIGMEKKLANYIHLPLQSGSDRILKEMNRYYDITGYMQKIDWIREYIPDAGLTSDVIIGFPGETEEDFELTLSAAAKAEYNNLFMFLYSKRSGTPAAVMPDQVPDEIKKQRLNVLIKQQSEIESRLAERSVGKIYKTLCDTEGETVCGKNENDKPIIIENAPPGLKNRFVDVEITKAVNSKLYGRIVNNFH